MKLLILATFAATVVFGAAAFADQEEAVTAYSYTGQSEKQGL